jgi:chromosome segregation ATPase
VLNVFLPRFAPTQPAQAGLNDRCASLSSATAAAEVDRDRVRAALEKSEGAYAALRDTERETASTAARLEAEAISLRKRIEDLQARIPF